MSVSIMSLNHILKWWELTSFWTSTVRMIQNTSKGIDPLSFLLEWLSLLWNEPLKVQHTVFSIKRKNYLVIICVYVWG